jgi:nucleotide-binding universal stress UspA family protein
MFPFRKILFPVDYSAAGETAVPYVKELLRRFSANLTLVHAYGAEALAYSQLPLGDPDLPDEARAGEERRLREFAMTTFPGTHVETFAQLGEPGTVIDEIMERQTTDLIMLPTHGRGPVRRFLLGSVATKVLHDAGAAVWTCSSAALANHAAQIPYRSILCALDDSDEAEGVLRAAAAFACIYRAQLRLVRIVETPSTSAGIDFGSYKKDLMDMADFELRELKGELGIDVPHAVIDAAVAGGVREEAILRKADLIIAGRGHSQATFDRMWSHIYPIVREAPCPVLSI